MYGGEGDDRLQRRAWSTSPTTPRDGIGYLADDSGTERGAAPLAQDVEVYLAKYRADIDAIGTTPETFSATYNVLLQVVPTKLRGM